MREVILRMENITKEFPGVKALDNVNLNVYKGKVMALLGENGAGKARYAAVSFGLCRGVVEQRGAGIFAHRRLGDSFALRSRWRARRDDRERLEFGSGANFHDLVAGGAVLCGLELVF